MVSNTSTYHLFQIVRSFAVVELSCNLLETFTVAWWPYPISQRRVIAGSIIVLEKYWIKLPKTTKFFHLKTLYFQVCIEVYLWKHCGKQVVSWYHIYENTGKQWASIVMITIIHSSQIYVSFKNVTQNMYAETCPKKENDSVQ